MNTVSHGISVIFYILFYVILKNVIMKIGGNEVELGSGYPQYK